MTAASRINNPTHSASFHAQFLYHSGKKCLSSYCDLHDRVWELKAREGVKHVSFNKYFNEMLENIATCISQGLHFCISTSKLCTYLIMMRTSRGGWARARIEDGWERPWKTRIHSSSQAPRACRRLQSPSLQV